MSSGTGTQKHVSCIRYRCWYGTSTVPDTKYLIPLYKPVCHYIQLEYLPYYVVLRVQLCTGSLVAGTPTDRVLMSTGSHIPLAIHIAVPQL